MIDKLIKFCLENKLIVYLGVVVLIFWGILVAPFDWHIDWLSRAPVPVDAIPDIGENQHIVFTRWAGRSPQDIEDQVTYPLTVALLGVPEVKTVRSFSMFGFSSIYVIFKDGVDFYWARSRVNEKLSSLQPGLLPGGVQPIMGPDATALGQIFWYTLEGRDTSGNPTGGWDLHELRTIQDWQVRYALSSAQGVAEVASVGGFVKEYQVDVDPDAMRSYGITLEQIYRAVQMSNLDVSARTIEINSVEYVIRGIGFLKSVSDIEQTVVAVHNNTPITIGHVSTVGYGPALRRGVLDKGGAEVVGGVVVARYGENPMAVIDSVKSKIREIAPGLPSKKLADGRESKVTVVPFYDRTGLIRETLGTLSSAIYLQILVTVLVIIILINNISSSLVISSVLPLVVLMSFIGMKLFNVNANIVSLSGIAIAIGTIVDMGIVLSENVLNHFQRKTKDQGILTIVYNASSEVGSAIVTAVLTTIISFLPVFTMEAAEGKLFKPLAFTKTFALAASIIITLTVLPPTLHLVFQFRNRENKKIPWALWSGGLIIAGIVLIFFVHWWVGVIALIFGLRNSASHVLSDTWKKRLPLIVNSAVVAVVTILLTADWLPLGAGDPYIKNLLFVILVIGGLLLFFRYFISWYPRILAWLLDRKAVFLTPVLLFVVFGMTIWLGFENVFFFIPKAAYRFRPLTQAAHAFPGLGKEFMPPLDEGSYLYMPTTMTHASIGEVTEIMAIQDRAIMNIPEVEVAVGKLGRVESPLDPAPISMIETIINIKSEYIVDESGTPLRFKFDKKKGEFVRDSLGELIQAPRGKPYRNWRPHITVADDIWDEIVKKAQVIGVTAAPKLQPISARIVMLQSGMRAPMGIKVRGPDLPTIEQFGIALEKHLKEVPSVEKAAVFAERIVGKPYLEIEIDRSAIARYGIHIRDVQNIIEIAMGGKAATTTIEGRQRYNVRVRYPRERRGIGDIEEIGRILVTASDGTQIPLGQLSQVVYRRGPQVIKSEDTFLTGYVLFDKRAGYAEVDVVEDCQTYLRQIEEKGTLKRPQGVSYEFAGSYKNQVRSEKRLRIILPIALFAIFLILYLQFKRVSTTLLVFAGIWLAWSGGFILLWLYGQNWFLDLPIPGIDLRDLFQIHQIYLSVAVWVGFLALFGIATDDGVVMCTYLDQHFANNSPRSVAEIRAATVAAASRRVRPALMTSATTILALLPILTSMGRGADVMIPMAIPSFGGMVFELLTIFLAPVVYCWLKERRVKKD